MSLLDQLKGYFSALFDKQATKKPYPEDVTEVIPSFYDNVPMQFLNGVLQAFALQKSETIINKMVDVTSQYDVPETDTVYLCVRRAYYAGGSLCIDAEIAISRVRASGTSHDLLFRGGSVILVNMRKRTIPSWFAACLSMSVAELDAGNEEEIMAKLALSKEAETHLRAVYLSTKERIGHGPYFLNNSTNEQVEEALQFCMDNNIEIVTPLVADPSTPAERLHAEIDRANIAAYETEKHGGE